MPVHTDERSAGACAVSLETEHLADAAPTSRADSGCAVAAAFSAATFVMGTCIAGAYLLSRWGLPELHVSEVAGSLGLLFALLALFGGLRHVPALPPRNFAVVTAGALLLGVWLSANVLGHHTHDPLALELRAAGKGGCDAFWHAALAQNASTYGVISAGLNGVVPFHYHALSHWLFVFTSRLLDASIFNVYLIAFPIVVVPLVIRAFFSAAAAVREVVAKPWTLAEATSPLFWCASLVLIAGCFPPALRKISGLAYSTPYCSESQTFALMLFLFGAATAIRLFQGKHKWWLVAFIPALAVTLTATKVVWLALCPVILGFLFLRVKAVRTFPAAAVAALAVVGAYLANKLTGASECTGGLVIKPWDIFQYMAPGHNAEYLAFWYFPIWALLAGTIMLYGIKSLRRVETIPAQLVAVLFVVFFGLVNIIELTGGAGTFFLDPIRWIALVSILALLPFNHPHAGKIAAVAAVLALFNIGSEAANAIERNREERAAIATANYEKNPRYQFLRTLEGLHQLPLDEKRETLLFIPQSCDIFWNSAPDRYAPFSAVALSGLSLLDGMPPADHQTIGFGFEQYTRRTSAEQNTSREHLLKSAQQLGFHNVIVADWRGGPVIEKLSTPTNR